jgi:hypothetical protein
MPYTPAATINDLPKSERAKFKRLAYERAVLQYAFSYERLSQFMSVEDMKQCVSAWTEDEAKTVKQDLNANLSSIYVENGIDKTLRAPDPFGRPKDFIFMEGRSTSFSQAKAVSLLVSGVFRWVCPKCDHVNITAAVKGVVCVGEGCNFGTTPRKEIKEYTEYSLPADVVTAVFAMATTQTVYTTLQARDVKEGRGK